MASTEVGEGAAPPATAPADVEKRPQPADTLDQDQDQTARMKATDRVIQSAKTATEKEQNMTLLEGIRLYPKAIAWSALISTCIVMEGYDVCLINNFCGCLPSLSASDASSFLLPLLWSPGTAEG